MLSARTGSVIDLARVVASGQTSLSALFSLPARATPVYLAGSISTTLPPHFGTDKNK